jgi:predicted AlkP superfamily pyrophosphatase or phosphodiesterase
MVHSRSSSLLFLLLLFSGSIVATTARVTVIFVIDQFPYHLLQRVKPYLHWGIKTLLNDGAVYENAYYPHAMPGTSTGHTALATGCYAQAHGIINNKWLNADGTISQCDDDTPEHAAVFASDGTLLNHGKSAKNIMVPGLSDQFVLQARPEITNHAVSISYKSRAAIATAGTAGKAIWFDNKTGCFTSSKAYFDSLPQWLMNFNTMHKLPKILEWKLFLPRSNAAYSSANIDDYTFSSFKKTIIGTKISLPDTTDKDEPYSMFTLTPQANKLLLDLAITVIDEYLVQEGKQHLLLWVCLSPFDFMCHRFGPESREAYDMIYHLDAQLRKFMFRVASRVKRSETLYVLTADHGVAPIPEMAYKEGIKSAQRVNARELIQNLNTFVEQKYGLKNFILTFKMPQFYCDEKLIESWDKTKKHELMNDIVKHLKKASFLANAWTARELLKGCFEEDDVRFLFKNQLFPGRSGQVIVQLKPFCQISDYVDGTDHMTPYEHDTHVPLILYQYDLIEELKICKRVSMLQVANSIAQALDIPKPPASKFEILPALFPITRIPYF